MRFRLSLFVLACFVVSRPFIMEWIMFFLFLLAFSPIILLILQGPKTADKTD